MRIKSKMGIKKGAVNKVVILESVKCAKKGLGMRNEGG